MVKGSLFCALVGGIVLVGGTSFSHGQNSKEDVNQKRLEFYKQSLLENQNSSITQFGDAEADHFIDIADSAISKLYTSEGKANELRSIARKLDKHLIELLANDTGRWIATNKKSVRIFIGFDSDSLLISDRGILNRAGRLRASAKALKDFNTSQGKFDAAKSEAVRSILVDASWVDDMRNKIKNRLLIVEQLMTNAPKSGDFESLPTLATVKRQLIAKAAMSFESEMQAVRESADRKGQEQELDAEFDRRFRNASKETEAKDSLADFNIKLMESEYGVKEAVVKSKIKMANAKKTAIEADTRAELQKSQKKLLVAYLTSPRVKQLLSPFCEPGMTKIGAWNKNFKIKELDPRPISLGRLANYRSSGHTYEPLTASQKGMRGLIVLANLPHNDRPSWPVTEKNWNSVGNSFEDMNGQMVNPYREAQRIIREHGPTLIELKMLVK